MHAQRIIRLFIPPRILNSLLLMFPFLYRTKTFNYESQIWKDNGINELLSQLDLVTNLQGNIIECGSARCGTSIIMAEYLRTKKIKKLIYACDSFEGFERSELIKEKQLGLTTVSEKLFSDPSYSYDYVKRKINKLGYEEIIIPIKGYFKDTISHIKSNFCFAFIDCDLKNSILYCAETVWPNLENKGIIIFDDYKYSVFKGTRLAIDKFVDDKKNEITDHGLLNRLYYVCKK